MATKRRQQWCKFVWHSNGQSPNSLPPLLQCSHHFREAAQEHVWGDLLQGRLVEAWGIRNQAARPQWQQRDRACRVLATPNGGDAANCLQWRNSFEGSPRAASLFSGRNGTGGHCRQHRTDLQLLNLIASAGAIALCWYAGC
jgi:hypothetical protein